MIYLNQIRQAIVDALNSTNINNYQASSEKLKLKNNINGLRKIYLYFIEILMYFLWFFIRYSTLHKYFMRENHIPKKAFDQMTV
tara:strand:+ start:78 stop:329 length:252 start_codon:yes stop_codon:yes gene_type:complete